MKVLNFPLTIDDSLQNTYNYKAFFQKGIKEFENFTIKSEKYYNPVEIRKKFSNAVGKTILTTGVNPLDVIKNIPNIAYIENILPNKYTDSFSIYETIMNSPAKYKTVKVDESYMNYNSNRYCHQKFKGMNYLVGGNFKYDKSGISASAGYTSDSNCSVAMYSNFVVLFNDGIYIAGIVIDENDIKDGVISENAKCTTISFTGKKYKFDIGTYYYFELEVYSFLNNNRHIDTLNYLLKNVEPVIPVEPKIYLSTAKFVGYPKNTTLPISIPVDLYDGEKLVKSIDLTKEPQDTVYGGRTELPNDKTYTAKVNTLKMDKNLLNRTKITAKVSPDKWSTEFTFTCTNTDPYPGGGSDTGGGTDGIIPTPGQTIDGVDLPVPPGISVTDTGLVTLYHPTISQVKELSRVLWKPTFFEKISKMFNNPMDALQGLIQVPIEVGNAGSQELVVGNVGTGINMNVCAKQYIFTSVGTIQVPGKYNSYLDYSPYTKVQIFLPFIGFRPLNTDEIMNDTITVTYQFDILTGSCCATLLNSKGLMFANYAGNCATSIALSGRDFSNTIHSAITVATATGVAIATGGAGAPALASAGLSAETASTVSAIGSAGSVAGAVASSKPTVERSGSCSGSLSTLTTRTPYILVERPNPCIPANQNTIDGYPSFITKKLGDCNGLTSVYSCNLELITNATDNEKTEILNLLKGGVKI